MPVYKTPRGFPFSSQAVTLDFQSRKKMVAQLSCALIKVNMNDSCIWCCKETFSLTNKQTSQQEHYSIPVTMSSWF